MKVLLVAGARPNFMKIGPIYRASLGHAAVDCILLHTGQHYDYEMSQAFFEDLELPKPDYFLDVGSASHAVQTAKIMVEFEKVCGIEKPDLVMVVGDVNSTLACSIVAKKMQIKVAHIEAGLHSFYITMPEEINRMVTDVISDFFFVTEESGAANLKNEGQPEERIHLVGNVMIDNLMHQAKVLEQKTDDAFQTAALKAESNGYAFLTLHRPSNVDQKKKFAEIADALNTIAMERDILFPIHPRTRKMMETHCIAFSDRIKLMSPLRFQEALYLWKDATVVLTDSGGLQEETTALKVPCVTIRENTERPITINMGTNILAGSSKEGILDSYREALSRDTGAIKGPPMWDGKAAERIWQTLLSDGKK